MTEVATPIREIHVAVAVIIRDGRVLIARRPDHTHQGGLLEFPGGKVEPGETVQQALVREIAEETALAVPEASLEPVIGIRHDYGDKRVFLDVWRTSEAVGEAVGCEGQPIAWLAPEELQDDQFPAANRPIIRALRLPSALAITGTITTVDGGVASLQAALADLVQERPLIVLRAQELASAAYRELAQQALAVCRRADTGLIVHGAPARFADTPGAAGLHLPWREAASLVSRPVPSQAWLGVSCHSADQLARAVEIGADYATLGPVRATATHPGAEGIGWDAFRAMAATATIPVFGLGGLNPEDIARARNEGGQGVAGIRFWWPQH
ncbi:Nudix family hydrolase [Marinobacter alexandrii]|uniref:Nudix family hydrolase n=1 Tax=Marinobacter alexandrii TaxID=2570351 RepID=UPI001FFEEFEC|nr:Nudix family hydrolase [Marinobacter alexandrii]MCK2149122.1 Nudix family hydrolase [Marinobacter alexandrii]